MISEKSKEACLMCWKNAFWFCWCAFFWTWLGVVLDAEQKHVQSITKLDCAKKSRSETKNNLSETPFLSFTPPWSLQKGQTASRVVCCKGRQSNHHCSVHTKEALLHRVTSAHTTGRGGELGTSSLGATTAHSGTLCFSLIIQSHDRGSPKLFDFH